MNTINKIILIILAVIVIAFAAISLKSRDTRTPIVENPPQNITVAGTYTSCIPRHDNFSSPECIEGIKLDDGSYYTLDFKLMSATKPELKNDIKITLQGVVVPRQGDTIAQAQFSVTSITVATSTAVTATSTSGGKQSATGPCYVGGCSGQICSGEQGMASTCEYREEYSCYKKTNAVCERQATTGKCGWTPTEKLNMCLTIANPTSQLYAKSWTWSESDKFSLTFKNDGTFGVKTDCNSVGGQFFASGNSISFSNIFQTEMFCGGSREGDFIQILQQASGYSVSGKGELVFDLKNGGKATLR